MKKVVKFGGSSLASAQQFRKVGEIVRAEEDRSTREDKSTCKDRDTSKDRCSKGNGRAKYSNWIYGELWCGSFCTTVQHHRAYVEGDCQRC